MAEWVLSQQGSNACAGAPCPRMPLLTGSSVEWEDEVDASGRKIAAPLVRKQAAAEKQAVAQGKQAAQPSKLSGIKRGRGALPPAAFVLRRSECEGACYAAACGVWLPVAFVCSACATLVQRLLLEQAE
jgi:hypothetical protein